MRGYFGIGVEGVSKPANVGSLFRSAHAFGAGFVFTIAADYTRRASQRADTSDASAHMPFYAFPALDDLLLPKGCKLIGLELTDDAIPLPSFPHPVQAAYVLGRERGSLTPELQARCDAIVQIPTSFCLNLSIAGALVMYDRQLALGRFAKRPVHSLATPEAAEDHVHGRPKFRTPERMALYRTEPPE